MLDWRESNLARKPRAFVVLHGWAKLVAIALGFAVTVVCVMALLGELGVRLAPRAATAIALAALVPAAVARAVRPTEDPLVGIGLTTETYALLLLGFAVAFVVGARGRTAEMLAREGDRAAREGAAPVARVAWYLAGARRR